MRINFAVQLEQRFFDWRQFPIWILNIFLEMMYTENTFITISDLLEYLYSVKPNCTT